VAFIGDENADCAPAYFYPARSSAMTLRRPTLHLFRDRIAEEKKRLEAKIELQPGPERDRLLMKLRQLDTASNIDEWLKSSELQSPR
jgi:hypothetical protein